jgi:hypothetical protein
LQRIPGYLHGFCWRIKDLSIGMMCIISTRYLFSSKEEDGYLVSPKPLNNLEISKISEKFGG